MIIGKMVFFNGDCSFDGVLREFYLERGLYKAWVNNNFIDQDK